MDKRRAVRVQNYYRNLAPIDALASVEISDRSLTRRATHLGFLCHAFRRLSSQVLGIELGDSCHNSVQELPGWCFIDVFFDRYQLRSGRVKFKKGVGVIPAVAGEAVHLVQDDVINVALCAHEAQHSLKLGPVGSLG
ncbi:hypothetical protein ND748_02905 [Frankia sp. AiPs1]|nr:hypothetical protein [Frankia sp. AiPs1]MCM3920630.1 hypothetical protein [Frankia sp. AiPs1]